jgi:hypothetical protein
VLLLLLLLLMLKRVTVISVVLPAHKEDERGSKDQKVNKMRIKEERMDYKRKLKQRVLKEGMNYPNVTGDAYEE